MHSPAFPPMNHTAPFTSLDCADESRLTTEGLHANWNYAGTGDINEWERRTREIDYPELVKSRLRFS
jgi:hypothetical protein